MSKILKKAKAAVRKQVTKTKTAIVKRELENINNPMDGGFSIMQGLDIASFLTPEMLGKFITPEILQKVSADYLPQLSNYLSASINELAKGVELKQGEFLAAICRPTVNNIALSIIVMNEQGQIINWVKSMDALSLVNSNIQSLGYGTKEIQQS